VIAASVFSDVSLLPVCNVNKTMLNRCILNFREWFKATKQMKYNIEVPVSSQES
jgi:hypothetical protein